MKNKKDYSEIWIDSETGDFYKVKEVGRMIKEDNCKCCNEVWNKSDIKEGLCPNCYYYFKSIKKQHQNQKAIECLNEIYNIYQPYEDDDENVILEKNGVSFIEYLDNKIKELEEGK